LAITPTVGALLDVDWAPVEGEGDKLLFIFDGGTLNPTAVPQPRAGEISGWSFVSIGDLGKHVPDRLARCVVVAITAREQGCPTYAEYGAAVSQRATRPHGVTRFGPDAGRVVRHTGL